MSREAWELGGLGAAMATMERLVAQLPAGIGDEMVRAVL